MRLFKLQSLAVLGVRACDILVAVSREVSIQWPSDSLSSADKCTIAHKAHDGLDLRGEVAIGSGWRDRCPNLGQNRFGRPSRLQGLPEI